MASGNEDEAVVVARVQELINDIAHKEGYNNFKLKTKSLTTDGANYMGDLYITEVVQDDKEPLHLFAKVANTPVAARAVIPANIYYNHEVFVYTTLADTYRKLEEKHGVPKENRFNFCKYYGSNLKEMEETIVLEDLAKQGYILYDRLKPIDWNYAKAAIVEIAKMHALSFAFKEEDPIEFEKIANRLPKFIESENFKTIVESIKKILPLSVAAVEPENRNKIQRYVDENWDDLLIKHFTPNSKYCTIIHGDYRASNILVKYVNDKLTSLRPVDYQTLCFGHPINDVLYLLFTGTDANFRRQHYDECIELYHSRLGAQLKALSHDVEKIYPKSAFLSELKEKLPYGLETALFTLSAVLVDPKAAVKVEEMVNPDIEKLSADNLKPNNLYSERLNGIVKDFATWGYLDQYDTSTNVQAHTTAADTGEKTEVIRSIETYVSTIADKEGFKNFKLKTTPMSTEGANYLGDLYYVDVIEDRKETLNLFVKTANVPEYLRKAFSINEVYKHEAFMYSTFADTYHELQKRHRVPEEKRFKFPKLYGANLKEMEEMLVLENLATQGYILYDRFKPVDWKYAKAAIEEIAKFHALSFALKKESKDTFNEITKNFDFKKREQDLKNMFDMIKNALHPIITIIEPENKHRVEKYINDKKDDLMIAFYRTISKYSAVTHFDYRASNIMVKYQQDDVVALKPVDYQGAFLGCPIYDILYFIFLGSDEEFRRKHFEECLEHYHNSLAAHLKLLSQDVNEIYPKSAFYFELKDKMLFGFEVALFVLGAVLLDSKETINIEDFMNTDNEMATSFKYSDQYVERLNGIVRDFVRWGFLEDEKKSPQVQNVLTTPADNDTNIERGSEQNDGVRKIESFGRIIAEREGIRDFSIKIKPVSTDGANYLGELYHVDLIENNKITNLFVKAANTPEHMRALMPVNELYKDEAFIYTTLADTYDELQKRHGVPEEKKFKFPKYYGAQLKEMEEMIALENLAAQGYILYDRFKPIDWAYAKAGVEEIAKFHALSYALEKENPETFNKILASLPQISRGEEIMKKMDINAFKTGMFLTMDLVEPENSDRMKKYVDDNMPEVMLKHFKSLSTHPTIIHADYRASNVMVKYQGTEVVALRPVDYQGVFYGCPMVDILSFLFLGSDEAFRRQHLEDYFEHYYNTLASHLKLLSQDVNKIYPKYAFYFDLKDKMPTGVLSALFGLNLVLADNKHNATIEDFMQNKMKPSEQYQERLNGIVRDFVKWGFLDEEDKSKPAQNSVTASASTDSNKESAATSINKDTSTVVVDSEPIDVIRNIERCVGSIAEKKGLKNFELKIKPVSTEGANYMADLFYVDVIENGADKLNLFVKAANTPAHVRKLVPINEVYRHEAFIYSTLGETYHEMQNKHRVPEKNIFKFPKLHGTNLKDMEEMLVFENLSAQGYILYDRFKPIDWDFAKAAVEEIAKFHAMSFALQRENPLAFQKILEKLPDSSKNEEMFKNFSEAAMKAMPLVMRSVESKYKNSLKKYVDDHKDKFMIKNFEPPTKHWAIIHADYRASNIMVKYEGSKVVALKPVDYQGGIIGSTVTDILSFLFLGSDEVFRRDHLADYFEHYHNTLAAHLKLLSQDINEIFPKSAFYFQLKDRMLGALDGVLFALHIILIDTKANMTIEDMLDPNLKQPDIKASEQYVERLNGIMKDFVRWGFLSEEQTNPPVANGSNNSKPNEKQIKKKNKKGSCCSVL